MCVKKVYSQITWGLCMGAQVERDPVGAQALTMSDRTMWQSLMELCCRKGRTADALQVTQREFLSLHYGSALLLTRLAPAIQEKLLVCLDATGGVLCSAGVWSFMQSDRDRSHSAGASACCRCLMTGRCM